MLVRFPIINTNFVKPLGKSTASNLCNKVVLPLTLAPVAAHYLGENKDYHAQRVIDFFRDNKIDLPSVIKKNLNGNVGFSESTKCDLRRKLQNAERDGLITTSEKNDCYKQIAFTGKSLDENAISMQDLAKNPELINNMSSGDILDIDTSLPVELETFMDTPLNNIPDGLMENIADILPEGFSVDDNMLSIAKGWLSSISEDLL